MSSSQNNSTTPPPSSNAVPGVAGHTATPAFIKRQQLQQQFQSPTDNILSPCSQMLSDPVALMRQKQKPKLLSKAFANSAKQQQLKKETKQQQETATKQNDRHTEDKEN